MTPQTSNINFRREQIDKVFVMLTSTNKDLQKQFDKYLLDEYEGDLLERLSYLDVSKIARFIVEKIKVGQTSFFQDFFNQIEFILSSCDKYVEDLLVEGLFECIQNNCGWDDIDYYQSFDQWLKPLSKQKWDKLIDFWEGRDWRAE